MTFNKYLSFLSIFFKLICTFLFLLLMKDVWNKYSSEITRTGTRVRYSSKAEEKKLPCLTVCPAPGFKVKGFFYQENSSLENSFSFEDVFAEKTILDLKNDSLFSISRPCSQYLGCCFTICHLIPYGAKNGPVLFLKTITDLKFFIHKKGSEFWFMGFNEFPYDIPFGMIETSNTKGIAGYMLSIWEYKTTVLSKKEEPCSESSEQYFIECCLKNIWKNIYKPDGCIIQEMKRIVPKDVKMDECQSEDNASDVHYSFSIFLNKFGVMPWIFGCPIPCQRETYKFTLESLHKNTLKFPGYKPEYQSYHIFAYSFATLNIEERIESLEYDFGNFLVAAGGNLGLFLGFSCLSVLLVTIEYAQNFMNFKKL